MFWKKPHISKIYEALTVIADDRIEMRGNEATCYSSSGDRSYEIRYDPKIGSIMSNDNAAYYTHTLSYPMIAFLMMKGIIPYDQNLEDVMPKIFWEDIYQNFKNDYDKSIKYVLGELKRNGDDTDFIEREVKKIYEFVCAMNIKTFGGFQKPPKIY